ncbi:YgiQ family radical SAM protein [Ideonella sp. DXS22W]|uniref:YgiQ family radical SAM protein n=1 Tax=Pseudaquabacterium inlustre TaxID=2984192 RepID=A0ABU9CLF4_9BURK
MPTAKPLTSWKPFWAKRFGTAPFLPTTRAEMEALGWDRCDIVIVTGDAYVDHPSFGMAVIGRVLEAQGFRVGILPQPDWHSADAFREFGAPALFFGVAAGNMDSMINHYTADRKIRSDDAYTPGDVAGKRPDRATLVYTQRCREAFKNVPVVIGGIEASLRRIAHYDYWSDTVRRSILVDSKADLLVYGNAERAIVEIAHRLAQRQPVESLTDIRGTAFLRKLDDPALHGWFELYSNEVDTPGHIDQLLNPYEMQPEPAATDDGAPPPCATGATGTAPAEGAPAPAAEVKPIRLVRQPLLRDGKRAVISPRDKTFIRLPAFEKVKNDPVLYAHASRVLHLETNPGNARALVQRHGEGPAARELWVNPPPIPLSTEEMDHVFDLPYARSPHPRYADEDGRHDRATKIPAWEMIRFSVNIMRGCFGGCSFCSITEHEGRIIQSRSEDSVIRELEQIRDKVEGFTGVVSDLGGPTANMYRLGCKSPAIEAACRKPSCVWPDICSNLKTDHDPLIAMYRRARKLPGIKKVLIGSGLRYDLAVRSPEYVKELVTHHVGGYLKIAPEHTEAGPLSKMMKPGIGTYDRFKAMFEKASEQAGKKQFLIPYFIAAHPGTTDEDMLNLALWLKRNGFRADQVQAFYPSPMASATAMYHSGLNTLKGIHRDRRAEKVAVVKGERQRRLHKAFLRYHDPANWPLLREALKDMGRADLIGNGKQQLIPTFQPSTEGGYQAPRRANSTPVKPAAKAAAKPGSKPVKGRVLTQHTGLPPREGTAGGKPRAPAVKRGRR